jgi:hypothetical protein
VAESKFQAVSETEIDALQIREDLTATPQRRKDARDRMKLPDGQGTYFSLGGRTFLYLIHPLYSGFAEEVP